MWCHLVNYVMWRSPQAALTKLPPWSSAWVTPEAPRSHPWAPSDPTLSQPLPSSVPRWWRCPLVKDGWEGRCILAVVPSRGATPVWGLRWSERAGARQRDEAAGLAMVARRCRSVWDSGKACAGLIWGHFQAGTRHGSSACSAYGDRESPVRHPDSSSPPRHVDWWRVGY
jgi:hypothetical protein